MNRGDWFGTGTVAAGVVAAALVMPGGTALAKGDKVGFIDVPRILEEFEGFRDARKDLERDRKTFGEEYQRRMMSLQKFAQDLQQNMGMLSDAKKKEKTTEFEKKRQEFSEWQELEGKKLQDREEGMIKRLEADVRKALEPIGSDGGFSFVVRKDLFLYVDKSAVDLTDQVLASLRKTAKESARTEKK